MPPYLGRHSQPGNQVLLIVRAILDLTTINSPCLSCESTRPILQVILGLATSPCLHCASLLTLRPVRGYLKSRPVPAYCREPSPGLATSPYTSYAPFLTGNSFVSILRVYQALPTTRGILGVTTNCSPCQSPPPFRFGHQSMSSQPPFLAW